MLIYLFLIFFITNGYCFLSDQNLKGQTDKKNWRINIYPFFPFFLSLKTFRNTKLFILVEARQHERLPRVYEEDEEEHLRGQPNRLRGLESEVWRELALVHRLRSPFVNHIVIHVVVDYTYLFINCIVRRSSHPAI